MSVVEKTKNIVSWEEIPYHMVQITSRAHTRFPFAAGKAHVRRTIRVIPEDFEFGHRVPLKKIF